MTKEYPVAYSVVNDCRLSEKIKILFDSRASFCVQFRCESRDVAKKSRGATKTNFGPPLKAFSPVTERSERCM